MKKTLLILLIHCVVLTFVEAQIQKGTYTMHPYLDISRLSTQNLPVVNTVKYNSINAGMNYGIFASNDLLISGGLNLFYRENGNKSYGSNASIAGQYYYWQGMKVKPYVSSSLNFSREISSFTQSTTKIYFNQLDISTGMGAQYFLNENIALDLGFNLHILGIDRGAKPLLRNRYTLNLQPFYTLATYKAANEIKDFFFKGKTQIQGRMIFDPKIINIKNDIRVFNMSLGGVYALHKFFGVGASAYTTISNYYNISGFTVSAESNIKLFKRFYLSPNLSFRHWNASSAGFVGGNNSTNFSSLNINLQTKFFINKNIAWTTDFLSLPIYKKSTSQFTEEKLFFRNGFAYYLK